MALQDFHITKGIAKIVIPANPEFRLDHMSPSQENHAATILLADKLVAAGVNPGSVIFGGDVRAIVGFSFMRRLYRHIGRFKENACDELRYPRYLNYLDAMERVKKYGMGAAIGRYLSERSGNRPTWHEPSESFSGRIETALAREFPAPAVLIVPIEAMILVFYTRVQGISRFKIPDECSKHKVWVPTAGAGVAIATDGSAVEFDRELNLVAQPSPV